MSSRGREGGERRWNGAGWDGAAAAAAAAASVGAGTTVHHPGVRSKRKEKKVASLDDVSLCPGARSALRELVATFGDEMEV